MSTSLGKSKTSSSTSSKAVNLQDVQGMTVVGNEVAGDFVMTDHQAVTGALDLVNNLVGKGVEYQAELYQGYGQQLQQFASKATTDQGDQLAAIMQYMIIGAVILGAVYLMKKGKA